MELTALKAYLLSDLAVKVVLVLSWQELRMELDKLLQRRIVCPGSVYSPHDTSLLNAIIDLVTTEEHRDQTSQQNHVLTMSWRGANRTVRRGHPARGK